LSPVKLDGRAAKVKGTTATGYRVSARLKEVLMRGLGILGIVLVVLGGIVLLLGGISYTKNRDEARIGPIRVAAEEREFIPPIAGVAALAIGVVLIATERGRKHA
jgi:predicted membrane channel-forming protein YqfA (hemolysin III family)